MGLQNRFLILLKLPDWISKILWPLGHDLKEAFNAQRTSSFPLGHMKPRHFQYTIHIESFPCQYIFIFIFNALCPSMYPNKHLMYQ